MSRAAVRSRRSVASRNARPALVALLVLVAVSATARADRYEAQWSMRPFAGTARIEEDGTDSQRATVGGLSLGLAYGLSNHLDIAAELVVLAAPERTFRDTMIVLDGGSEIGGTVTRQTGTALVLLGPTWRFGVTWVPVVSLGAGAGIRYRSAGTFLERGITPEEKREGPALDLAATARIGFEHRLNRRVTLGAYVSGLASWGPTAPLQPAGVASLGVSYVHYPQW